MSIGDVGGLRLYGKVGRLCVRRRKGFFGGWGRIWREGKRRRESGAADGGALEMGNAMARPSSC